MRRTSGRRLRKVLMVWTVSLLRAMESAMAFRWFSTPCAISSRRDDIPRSRDRLRYTATRCDRSKRTVVSQRFPCGVRARATKVTYDKSPNCEAPAQSLDWRAASSAAVTFTRQLHTLPSLLAARIDTSHHISFEVNRDGQVRVLGNHPQEN